MPPIEISAIPAFDDNYIWAMVDKSSQSAILVDVGDAKPALQFLIDNHLTLQQIWITHHHHDHIGGVIEICEHFPNAQVFVHPDVAQLLPNTRQIFVNDNDEFSAFGYLVQVWQVAGHTDNHLAYLLEIDGQTHVFCGDTLFQAGCGRVFTGTMEQLFASFQRLNTLDENTLFYPAHEYTLSNLKFAQHVEPDNVDIQHAIIHAQTLRNQQKPTLPTTLANERNINPFLRALQPNNHLMQRGKETQPFTIFAELRTLKNNF